MTEERAKAQVQSTQLRGISTVAECHLGIRDNHAFGFLDGATLSEVVADVVIAKPDAVAVLNTNLAGASHMPAWEQEPGLPALDSAEVSLYGALRTNGADAAVARTLAQAPIACGPIPCWSCRDI